MELLRVTAGADPVVRNLLRAFLLGLCLVGGCREKTVSQPEVEPADVVHGSYSISYLDNSGRVDRQSVMEGDAITVVGDSVHLWLWTGEEWETIAIFPVDRVVIQELRVDD